MTPDQTAALMRKAIRLQEQGEHRQALDLYAAIAERYPNHPDVLHNCAVARLVNGEFGAAESLLLRAIQLRPGFKRARANLVKLWTRMDRPQTLAEVAGEAAWLEALDFAACMALGEYFLKRREHGRAIGALQRAVMLDASNARARHFLGTALYRDNRAESAVGPLREALRLVPGNAAIMLDLARCLFAMHLRSKQEEVWAEGRSLIEQALTLDPANARIQHEMGMVLEEEGDFSAARATYEQALAVSPGFLPALSSLAAISRSDAPGELLTDLQSALAQGESYPASEQARAWQALGKCHDASGRYDHAFECFERANALTAGGRAYDREHHERYADHLIETYCSATIAEHWPRSTEADRPLFIVGMPRSGTTLLEHILSSHPQINGAGELPFFTSLEQSGQALHETDGKRSGAWDERILPPYRAALRERFESILQNIDGEARFLIDKMPFNFLQLGMITWLYPQARILHCTRDRLDVGLSCFIESFHESHVWSLSLESIGHYMRQYERLMAHWLPLFAGRIHEVRYERLVSDWDSEIDAVLGFVGLDRTESMASYARSKRPVRTPSKWQVRQPIYGSSVGRWQRYERHLGPLMDELAL